MEAIFHWKNDLYFWSRFESTARLALSDLQTGQVAADLGGGRRCAYAKSIDVGATLMAIDIDQNELDHNLDVELKVCGDISKQLPIEPNAVDLILSRALLEHVQDNDAAFREMYRILKPNSKMIHFIPAKNSTFGIAARTLPFEKLKSLLHLAVPSSKGEVEFPIFYNRCTPGEMEALLKKIGFVDVKIELCYYASGYFYSVLPAYLLVVLYQFLIRSMKVKQLSQYMIVSAAKPLDLPDHVFKQ